MHGHTDYEFLGKFGEIQLKHTPERGFVPLFFSFVFEISQEKIVVSLETFTPYTQNKAI